MLFVLNIKVIAQWIGDTIPPNNINFSGPCALDALNDPNYVPGTTWQGPKYFKVCLDSDQVIPNCCYWIVYYDRKPKEYEQRFYEPPYPTFQLERYEINVTGITFDGVNCEKRSKGEILLEFYNGVLQKNWETDTNFFLRFFWIYIDSTSYGYAGQSSGGGWPMDVYTTGGCFRTDTQDTLDCYLDSFCCHTRVQVEWERYPYKKVWASDTAYPSLREYEVYKPKFDSSSNYWVKEHCVEPCELSKCNDIKMVHYYPMACPAPCIYPNDTVRWEVKPDLSIPLLPWCPNCNLKVSYKLRVSNLCPEAGVTTFNDILLDDIEIDSTTLCDPNCFRNIPMQMIHSYVVDYLTENMFENYPAPNQCDTNYRIFQSSCWGDFFQEGWTQYYADYENYSGNILTRYWPPFRYLNPCTPYNCCWTKYQICTDQEGHHNPTRIETQSDQTPCWAPTNCTFLCGEE